MALLTRSHLVRVLGNLCLIIVSFLITLCCCELLLRFTPNPWVKSTFEYKWHQKLGYWPAPNQNAIEEMECFSTRVSTNSHGMRDLPRKFEKDGFRVAMFGDSYLEARQVNDDEVVNRLLESRFPSIDFLNFGVSGYGPGQEWIAYQQIARSFQPDLVVLLIWPPNDISDSSRDLLIRTGEIPGTKPSFYLSNSGDLLIEPVRTPDTHHGIIAKFFEKELKDFVRRKLFHATFNLYDHAMGTFRYLLNANKGSNDEPINSAENEWGPFYPPNVFRPPVYDIWKDAWEITEKVIVQFARESRADGAEFILIVHDSDASFFTGNANDLRGYNRSDDPPQRFNLMYPFERLSALCAKEGIPFLSLIDGYKSYKHAYNLDHGFLTHDCDGHWNSLGHRLSAQLIGDFIVENSLIPAK